MTASSLFLRPQIAKLAVAVALSAGLAGIVVRPSPASAADDGGFAQKMLTLVNQQRAAVGAGPLQVATGLAQAAHDGRYTGCGFAVSGRAADMGARNYFSHGILGCGTQNVSNMLPTFGVQTTTWAENIGWMNGTTDPLVAAERLTNDLMASSGHRANMLNANFTHIGIGSWRTAAGQTWSGGGYALTNVFVTAQVFARLSTTSTTAPTTTSTTVRPTTTTSTTVKPTTTTSTTVRPTTTTTTIRPTTTTTAPLPALPQAPTAVNATGGDGTIAVTWGPAASGPAVDSYGVLIWDGAGYTNRSVTSCAACRSTTLTGVPNGKTYYVTVHGHNAAGWGGPGYSQWITVAAVPGAPTEVRAVPGNASVSATWRGPTNPGTAIDGYAMFIFDPSGYTGKFAYVCSTCTSATVPGLTNGQTYVAVIYAHNPNGWGAYAVSEWVAAGTPGPPGNVSVGRGGSGSVNAAWSAASNSGSALDMYGLFAYDANGYTGLYGTACPTCTFGTVSGLVPGRTYTITVYGHNGYGWGVPVSSTQVVA